MTNNGALRCFECGCNCRNCSDSRDLDYHRQIEELESRIREQRGSISRLEQELGVARDTRRLESEKLQEELARLRDRYDRLFDSHKKLSRVNAGLEEKLLTLAGRFDSEQRTLADRLNEAETRLAESLDELGSLRAEKARYKSDCELAVQLLQSKPGSFVSQRLSHLPLDLRDRLRPSAVELEDAEPDTLGAAGSAGVTVPLPTFPPTFAHFSAQLPRTASAGDVAAIGTNHQQQQQGQGLVAPELLARALSTPREMCRECRGTGCRLQDLLEQQQKGRQQEQQQREQLQRQRIRQREQEVTDSKTSCVLDV